jgi:hypothetical protein
MAVDALSGHIPHGISHEVDVSTQFIYRGPHYTYTSTISPVNETQNYDCKHQDKYVDSVQSAMRSAVVYTTTSTVVKKIMRMQKYCDHYSRARD